MKASYDIDKGIPYIQIPIVYPSFISNLFLFTFQLTILCPVELD